MKKNMVMKQPKMKKKIKIESTKIAKPLQPGSHQLMALQKHQGIVKRPLAKKLESIEHWIKKRNLGELAAKEKAKKKREGRT